MNRVNVVYWSQGGNTKAMAEAIGEGIVLAGKEAVVIEVSEASVEELKNSAGFALGCPAMGAEVLEEMEMEPFVCELEKFVSGKQIVLFGSYGWGDGQWMREWQERMSNAGAIVMGGEGIIAQGAPDISVVEKCRNLGKQIAII